MTQMEQLKKLNTLTSVILELAKNNTKNVNMNNSPSVITNNAVTSKGYQ